MKKYSNSNVSHNVSDGERRNLVGLKDALKNGFTHSSSQFLRESDTAIKNGEAYFAQPRVGAILESGNIEYKIYNETSTFKAQNYMHANGGKYAINLPTGLSVGSNTGLSQNMMTVDFSVNRKAIMEYGEDGEVKTYSYNTLSSSERSVSSGSKDVSDRAVSYGTDRFGNINSVVGDDGNGEANVGDSVYTHGLLTRVKSGSADIKSGTVDGAINGLIDRAIDGVMWGGIFAGSAQILGGASKLLSKRTVTFLKKQIGFMEIRILNPLR